MLHKYIVELLFSKPATIKIATPVSECDSAPLVWRFAAGKKKERKKTGKEK